MCSRQRTCQKKRSTWQLYEIQISPERGLRRNSLKFPSYFGMEYVRPWNMGKKLLEYLTSQTPSSYNYCKTSAAHLASVIFCFGPFVVLHMLHQSAVVWGAGHICRKLQWRLVDLHFQNPATCKRAIAMWRAEFCPRHENNWKHTHTHAQFYQTFMCIREALAGDH